MYFWGRSPLKSTYIRRVCTHEKSLNALAHVAAARCPPQSWLVSRNFREVFFCRDPSYNWHVRMQALLWSKPAPIDVRPHWNASNTAIDAAFDCPIRTKDIKSKSEAAAWQHAERERGAPPPVRNRWDDSRMGYDNASANWTKTGRWYKSATVGGPATTLNLDQIGENLVSWNRRLKV